jgi:predicted ribosomally synthesized peptide with SipW-like signal peptide
MSDAVPANRRNRRRKVAAILAGGVVVGVGTMATLAAWTDTEYATGSFTAGKFTFQGSTDQTNFTEHTTSGTAATLSFTSPLVTQMSPNDVVYSAYALRLYRDSTNGANVVITAPSTTGVTSNITYTVIKTATAGCSAASTGTAIVPAGTALGGVGSATSFTLAAPPADHSTDGVAAYLCFKVTAGSGLVQGQSGTATWLFTATSN